MKNSMALVGVILFLLFFVALILWAVWDYAKSGPYYKTVCIEGVTYFSGSKGIQAAKIDVDGKPIRCQK